jgi:hypothetical protein
VAAPFLGVVAVANIAPPATITEETGTVTVTVVTLSDILRRGTSEFIGIFFRFMVAHKDPQ